MLKRRCTLHESDIAKVALTTGMQYFCCYPSTRRTNALKIRFIDGYEVKDSWPWLIWDVIDRIPRSVDAGTCCLPRLIRLLIEDIADLFTGKKGRSLEDYFLPDVAEKVARRCARVPYDRVHHKYYEIELVAFIDKLKAERDVMDAVSTSTFTLNIVI